MKYHSELAILKYFSNTAILPGLQKLFVIPLAVNSELQLRSLPYVHSALHPWRAMVWRWSAIHHRDLLLYLHQQNRQTKLTFHSSACLINLSAVPLGSTSRLLHL